MPPIADYSTTPASNTAISGINLSEGCTAGGINNAIRQLMADVKAFSNTVPVSADFMPIVGGTFTGDITRNGRGGYLHHASSTYLSGRVFVTALGAADPTSAVGDIWIELSA